MAEKTEAEEPSEDTAKRETEKGEAKTETAEAKTETAEAEADKAEAEADKAKAESGNKSNQDETREDNEELPQPDEDPDVPPVVAAMGKLQDVVYFAIGAILLVLAAAESVHIVIEFLTSEDSFPHRVTEVIHGVLFVIIVMELLRTVLAHFEDDTFHLKPFMIIGIISVVRHILTVGAEVSLEEAGGGELFHRSDIELGVNALVVLVLVLGLVMVRETED